MVVDVMSPLQVLLEHFQTTKYSYSGFVQSQLWKDRHQHHDISPHPYSLLMQPKQTNIIHSPYIVVTVILT